MVQESLGVLTRGVAMRLVAVLMSPAASLKAGERVIRCESRNHQYHDCQADTDNRASLVSQTSIRAPLTMVWPVTVPCP